MRLSLIAALDRNGLIGSKNALPWRLPADLKHFKAITMNKPVIMGRKTYESIGRPLPGRRNMVISRQPAREVPGVDFFSDPNEVISALGDVEEAVVIGGAEIYRLFWDNITRMYITLVDADCEGDTWFPKWPLASNWELKSSQKHASDASNPYPLTFQIYEKVENI